MKNKRDKYGSVSRVLSEARLPTIVNTSRENVYDTMTSERRNKDS